MPFLAGTKTWRQLRYHGYATALLSTSGSGTRGYHWIVGVIRVAISTRASKGRWQKDQRDME